MTRRTIHCTVRVDYCFVLLLLVDTATLTPTCQRASKGLPLSEAAETCVRLNALISLSTLLAFSLKVLGCFELFSSIFIALPLLTYIPAFGISPTFD